MAKCPRCHASQSYSRSFLASGSKAFPCEQCGASLRAEETRLVPYVLAICSVAIIIAASMMIAGRYLTGIVLLLAWTGLALAVYPLVLTLSAADQ